MDIELRSELVIELKKEVQSLPRMTTMTDTEMKNVIEERFEEKKKWAQRNASAAYAFFCSLTFKERSGILESVFDSIRGLDVLGRILSDKSITEIMINGYDNIFIERFGKLEKLNEHFESRERLTDVIVKFVSDAGRAVNESNPIVDTRLKDGSRVNVVLPPIALNGPIVTIRRFPEKPMTVEKLIEYGSITPQAADALEKLVRAKYNIFVSGGTGSGKTTFLNALSNFIPKHERIITIEDSAELQINQIPNIVRLETRNANSAGVGGISMRELIKSSLRMRPERIVVGEVRGEEALDMLQAMNTGHDGSLSTGHANSSTDMLSRLETMILSGSAGLPLEAIRQQIASAVDIIIHLSRLRDFSRRTMEISEVVGYENGVIQLSPLFKFEEDAGSDEKRVLGSLKRTEYPMLHTQKLRNAGIYDAI